MAPRQPKSERKANPREAMQVKLLARVEALEKSAPSMKERSLSFRTANARSTRSWCMNLVCQLHLLGTYNSEEIVEYLKERHGIVLKSVTVRKYIAEMRKKWQEQAMEDTNTMITKELAKLQQLEEFTIGALRDGGLRVTDDGTFMQVGDPESFCNIMLKISKRRATLMGLDKGQKLIITDERASDLSDEELEKIITQRKEKAA